MTLTKWGNSIGTRIPSNALAVAGFSLGDEVEIEAKKGVLVIKQAMPEYTLDALLSGVTPEMVELNDDDKLWLGSAVGSEVIDD